MKTQGGHDMESCLNLCEGMKVELMTYIDLHEYSIDTLGKACNNTYVGLHWPKKLHEANPR